MQYHWSNRLEYGRYMANQIVEDIKRKHSREIDLELLEDMLKEIEYGIRHVILDIKEAEGRQ